jgi:transposase
MPRYVGLDVHSKASVFVIQEESGVMVGEGRVPTTVAGLRDLRDRHRLEAGTPVALESGSVAFFAAQCLADLGLSPQVIDAREVRAKASRPFQKSDRRDALELCEGLRRGIYRAIVWVPPSPVRVVREVLSRRRHFVRLKTSQVNAAKRLLRSVGLAARSRSLQGPSSWAKLVASLQDEPRLQGFLEQHRRLWLCAHEQVQALEADLAELVRPWQAELDRLQTVPGVGTIVAGTALAVIFDARRFASAKHLASYAGLVPRTHQSGDKDRHGRITRTGSRELRSMLCEAAHQARRTDHPLNPYFRQVLTRRGYRMAIVAVAHRIGRILYALMRDGSTFDVSRVGVEEGPFTKVAVQRYRLRPASAV